jgi:hypothetical protein
MNFLITNENKLNADSQNLLFSCFKFSEIIEHSFSSNNSWKHFFDEKLNIYVKF